MVHLDDSRSTWLHDELELLDEQQADAAARARTAAALALIDTQQQHAPQCTLCGQRCTQLDRWGLCSKITERHRRARTQPPGSLW